MTTEQMLVAAISALAGTIVWLGRMFIGDLMRQRDLAIAGWQAADANVDRLAAALEVRNRRDEQTRREGDA